VFNKSIEAYKNATVLAGERVDMELIDMSLQAGYRMIGAASTTPQEAASEYYQADMVINSLISSTPQSLKHHTEMQVHAKMTRLNIH